MNAAFGAIIFVHDDDDNDDDSIDLSRLTAG